MSVITVRPMSKNNYMNEFRGRQASKDIIYIFFVCFHHKLYILHTFMSFHIILGAPISNIN